VFGPALVCPGIGCSSFIKPEDVKRLLLGSDSATRTDTDANALWSAYEAAYAEAEKVPFKHKKISSCCLKKLIPILV
jgi:hypothetical protein